MVIDADRLSRFCKKRYGNTDAFLAGYIQKDHKVVRFLFTACLYLRKARKIGKFRPWILKIDICLNLRPIVAKIYTLHVFRSGASSAAVTEVIIPMRGSLISFRMMLESSFCTSPLILVFLILFFLNLIPHFYLGTSTMI